MADTTGPVTVPRVPLGDAAVTAVDWLERTLAAPLDVFADGVTFVLTQFEDLLLLVPSLLMVAVLAALGAAVRSLRFGLVSLLGLLLVVSMEMWEPAMATLALILTATAAAAVIGVPLGVLAARNARVSALVRPVLDFMQTMPAYVYLIPAVAFFSIGVVPGFVTTVIFALPPGVRLTELGIRQVDAEVVEAGTAFGGSPWQILRGIQLPLALPTIMAGINQVIMLALSMSVIAGIIGAPGLGSLVVTSISRLDLSLGIEAGVAVVVVAIYLDRMTSALGAGTPKSHYVRLRTMLSRGSTASGHEALDPDLPPEAAPRPVRVR